MFILWKWIGADGGKNQGGVRGRSDGKQCRDKFHGIYADPFVKGAVGGILTFAVGILLLPFWLIVGLGIGAVALLVGGLAAVVAGAGLLTVMTGTGIMTIGIGCLMIALAILMVLGLISVAVRIVPKWFRKITDFFNRVLYRKRKEAVK